MLLMVSGAQAQIGHKPVECRERWGKPVAGHVETNGYGTLRFAAGDISITIDFVSGTAQRVICRKALLNDADIGRLLTANADEAQWQTWITPGRKPVEGDPRRWIRSDERGMAKLVPGMLTIQGRGWARHVADSLSGPKVKKQPVAVSGRVPPPKKVSPASTAPEAILGLWRSDDSVSPTVVLRVRPKGEATWIVLGKRERQEQQIRWTELAGEGRPFYTLSNPSSTAGAPPKAIASGQLASRNQIRIHPVDASVLTGLQDVSADSPMAFKRIASMPLWKPAAPAVLPAKGDSRKKAVRLLGKPKGTMLSNSREGLVYSWGYVWITNGVVAGIE
jgi:hypothetical protein